MKCYESLNQSKNLAWFLPRPKPDHYVGGMPLHAENWLVELAKEILQQEQIKLLNLFCGMNKQGYRIDIKAEVKPDLVADAHDFADLVAHDFDVILADPPYSYEESVKLYGTGKIVYKQWTGQCDLVLKPMGLLIVYHRLLMPNPFPDRYSVVKRVFIAHRIKHTPRVAIYFRKNR